MIRSEGQFKILYIGCVHSSYRLLETILQVMPQVIGGVVTKSQSSINSDFKSLRPLAKEFNIPFIEIFKNNNEQIANFSREIAPDLIYCFGWSHLLEEKIIGMTRKGAIGFHPAPLPIGRGRHPLIWALALGLKETASTFFKIRPGIDDGAIVSQEKILITGDDKAADLYDRILEVACKQVVHLTAGIIKGEERETWQNEKEAVYWRKRTRADGIIDFRMSATSIYNLVRALSSPYPNAEVKIGDRFYKVREVRIVDAQNYIEPGKIIMSDDRGIIVKCGEGAIELIDHEIPVGNLGGYIL